MYTKKVYRAKDMAKWAFELSEEVRNVVMLRSVTRMSHASGNVVAGELARDAASARFAYDGGFMDQIKGPVLTFPTLVDPQRRRQLAGLKKAAALFETSPFNAYQGPKAPQLLIVASSAAAMYCREAVEILV